MPLELIPLYAASGMIVFDIGSGILKGITAQHSLRSSIMMAGMVKKMAIWYVIAFAMFVQLVANNWDMLPEQLGIIYPATCVGVCLWEGNSLMENFVEIWPEIVEFIPILGIFVHNKERGNDQD